MLAVGFGVLLFLLTSFSDPGTVKDENVSQYISAYPYDNILYMENECPTCKIPKFVILSVFMHSFLHFFLLCFLTGWFLNLGLLGRSTAKYASVVWHGLIIIVDGWCTLIISLFPSENRCLLGFV